MYYKWILVVKQKIIILESTDTENLAKEERSGDGEHRSSWQGEIERTFLLTLVSLIETWF